jgi:hypothetical protein
MVTAATNTYEVLAIRYGSRPAVKSEVFPAAAAALSIPGT